MIADRGVVHRVVEERWRSKNTPAQRTGYFLIKRIVAAGAELAHRVTIDYVNVLVLSGTHREMPSGPPGIHQVRQQNDAAGTQILIRGAFSLRVVDGKIVCGSEFVATG